MDSQQIQCHIEKTLKRSISEKQANLLLAHFLYVQDQNKRLNLTRIQDEGKGLVLHIEDSLSALPELEGAPDGALVDLGSGGGYPGIPLAIVSGRPCTLVEATQKKAQVLQEFINGEGLGAQIRVEATRIEELARIRAARFAAASARALSSLPALMELAAPLLQEQGVLIAYKGRPEDQELEDARSLEHELGMRISDSRSFALSDGSTVRTIIPITKIAPALRPLPRRNGQAQRHPLKRSPFAR
jgi:16S rRNA (guanine527-N7)-methyltransferase